MQKATQKQIITLLQNQQKEQQKIIDEYHRGLLESQESVRYLSHELDSKTKFFIAENKDLETQLRETRKENRNFIKVISTLGGTIEQLRNDLITPQINTLQAISQPKNTQQYDKQNQTEKQTRRKNKNVSRK